MFQNYKKTSLSLNGQSFVVEDVQISQDIQLTPRYTVESRVSETELPSSMWVGNCKIQYYLSGQDYLKQYIYSDELQPISGNLAGFQWNQGYLNNYSLSIQPNSPILVNATISFYDQLTGTFNNTSPILSTGTVLRTSDITINNLSNYSVNTLNFFTKASFDYSCSIKPSYNYYDTGIPFKADNISIEERTITSEIISDNTIFNLPISGENFGAMFTFSNPFNTGIYENFGCSGLISSKSLNINTSNPHNHSIKITQHHVNKNAGLSGVSISNTGILINSSDGSHPFLSRDNSLNYVEKIFVGDTQITGYNINRFSSYDQIVSPIPLNIVNDSLTIQTSYGNYVWPNKLQFTYPNITITGLSQYTGAAGNTMYISGTNFYRISDVFFGGNTEAQFQVIDPQTIITTIPNNGITSPMIVSSNLRSKSGVSPSGFYYQSIITNINPTTGLWKDTITVSGVNFSGITGVYFNNTPAFSFSILNNNSLTCRSPETGNPFPSGYINVYGTGGYGQSIPRYNPIVPIYSFSPTSGVPGIDKVAIYTKIDTGYMYPSGTGYLVRLGGVDTQFFISGNSTGILTGLLQHGTQDDYIYIYGPDGNLTYSNPQLFNVIGFPNIDYISPINVNQYQYFNMLIIGENLKFFTNQPWYVSLSGGLFIDVLSGNNTIDTQYYSTGSFNSSLNGDSILVNNIGVTGNTGYYDVIVQNSIGSYILISGLFVNPPINQSQNCAASFVPSSTAAFPGGTTSFGDTLGVYISVLGTSEQIITNSRGALYSPSNYLTVNRSLYSLDQSTGTVSIINSAPNSSSGFKLSISPISSPYLNISALRFNYNFTSNLYYSSSMSPLDYVNSLTYNGNNINSTIFNYSGSFALYQNSLQVYNSPIQPLNNLVFYATGGKQLTGITNISIFSTQASTHNSFVGLPIKIDIF